MVGGGVGVIIVLWDVFHDMIHDMNIVSLVGYNFPRYLIFI